MRMLLTDISPAKAAKLRYMTYAVLALLLSVIHVVFLNFVSVAGMTPDLLLILCVWIAVYENQFIGLIAAFCIGFFYDIVSWDVVGTNALAKTLVGFVAGFFYKENLARQIVSSYKFLFIVFICSVLNNIVYYFFFIKAGDLMFLPFFLSYGIAMSLYTTVLAVFVMLFMARRRDR